MVSWSNRQSVYTFYKRIKPFSEISATCRLKGRIKKEDRKCEEKKNFEAI